MAKRNTITDSSTASDRCMCSSLESSRLRPNKSSIIKLLTTYILYGMFLL